MSPPVFLRLARRMTSGEKSASYSVRPRCVPDLGISVRELYLCDDHIVCPAVGIT